MSSFIFAFIYSFIGEETSQFFIILVSAFFSVNAEGGYGLV
jgi:hypothetical protein